MTSDATERALSPRRDRRTSNTAAATEDSSSSALDRAGRLYCPTSDSCQLTATGSATMRQHHQQPYLSCWLGHVTPTIFTDGQTRHS